MASGVAGEGDVGLAGFGFVCWLRDMGIRRVVGVLCRRKRLSVLEPPVSLGCSRLWCVAGE